jgi:hypothetical protein
VHCPVVGFGLGVQARLDEGLPRLGPGTLRLARALAMRAPQLSVRDLLTQEVLKAQGVPNTVVTGCPSNFINPDPDLGARIAERARRQARRAGSWRDLRLCISEASGGHAASGQVLSGQLRLLDGGPAFYLIQSPALLAFVLGERGTIPQVYKTANPWKGESGRLTATLKATVLHFAHVDAWMDFARTCDLSFGMRIHGTMLPLQAGVPSALIAHDSRTIGLAEQMGIPWVSPETWLEMAAEGPAPLLTHIASAMDGYDARRKGLAQTMMAYLEVNGLPPTPGLARLAGAA